MQQRTLIDLGDVVHIESECSGCHRVTILVPDMMADAKTPRAETLKHVYDQCLWCQKPMPNADVLQHLVEALRAIRAGLNRNGESFVFRLAIRDHE